LFAKSKDHRKAQPKPLEQPPHYQSYSHASLAERAWTDIVTNSVVIPSVDLKKDFELYYGTNGFPIQCLPSLLHESVHHWCFYSVVGSALAVLDLRALLRVMDEQLIESKEHWDDTIDDIVRFEVAQRVLRPLAEGLALFAEYDVEPLPNTRTISRPMSLAYGCFTPEGARQFGATWGSSLVPLLRNMRTSKQYILRKANLFLEPLSCSAGGYLPGYLTVKNLWRLAVYKCDAFVDRDLFLLLLQRYFYRDYGLVAHLLRPRQNGPGLAGEILNYVGKRLWDFQHLDFATEASRLESTDDLAETSPEEAIAGPIGTSRELMDEGKRILASGTALLRPTASDPEFHRKLKEVYVRVLAQRQYLCVGKFAVGVDRRKPGYVRVTSAGKTLMEEPVAHGPTTKCERGVLSLFMSMSALYKVVSIGVDGKVVAVKYPDGIEQIMANEISSFQSGHDMITAKVGEARGRIKREEFVHLLHDTVDVFSDWARTARDNLLGPRATTAIANVLAEFDPLIDNIYRTPVLLWEDKTEWPGKAEMANGGLHPVLVRGELVRHLAVLSLASSTSLSIDQVKSSLDGGEAAIAALEELQARSEYTGIPLVYELPDGKFDSFV
jgi:hypothetical protein